MYSNILKINDAILCTQTLNFLLIIYCNKKYIEKIKTFKIQ